MPIKGGLAFGLGKAGTAGKTKARSLAAFQAESDDEDTSQPKRQRTDANLSGCCLFHARGYSILAAAAC